MCALIFEYGIDTLSWYAAFALRRRVSMSAIGSVIVMASGLPRRGFQSAKSGTSLASLLCRWTYGVVADAPFGTPCLFFRNMNA
ncbi:hypothetical protein GCM10027203_12380 [Nonomuraea fastidiosa]